MRGGEERGRGAPLSTLFFPLEGPGKTPLGPSPLGASGPGLAEEPPLKRRWEGEGFPGGLAFGPQDPSSPDWINEEETSPIPFPLVLEGCA